jgi:hypothetical protein
MASYPTSASAAIGELDPASSNTLWAALLMGLRAPVGRHRSTMARLQVTRAGGRRIVVWGGQGW